MWVQHKTAYVCFPCLMEQTCKSQQQDDSKVEWKVVQWKDSGAMKLESVRNFTLLPQSGRQGSKVLHVADFVCRGLPELLNGIWELPNQWSAMTPDSRLDSRSYCVLYWLALKLMHTQRSVSHPNVSDMCLLVLFPDVNECDVQSPCQHLCYNLIGSFLCQCNQGYELALDAASCQGEHAHLLTRTCTPADCWTFVHTCLFPVQTLTNAASQVICASTSAWTPPAVTPASVQRDISSKETGCVKVPHPSFSSFCHLSNFLYLSSNTVIPKWSLLPPLSTA